MRSVVVPIDSRGAGLGNEIFPLAKALLGQQVFGGTVVGPWWGINKRRYDLEFGCRRLDGASAFAWRHAPGTFNVDAELLSSLGHASYTDSLRALKQQFNDNGQTPSVMAHTSGMYGMFRLVADAREDVRQYLTKAKEVSKLRSLLSSNSSIATKLKVGVHLRVGGDFDQIPPGPGEFNKALPLAWFLDAMDAAREAFGSEVVFLVASDEPLPTIFQGPDVLSINDYSDSPTAAIVALSECDLIVPSVSSFSMLSIYLSEAPYLWFGNHLVQHGDYGSIWGLEPDPFLASLTQSSLEAVDNSGVFRAQAYFGGPLSEEIVDQVRGENKTWKPEYDLLLNGVAPSGNIN